MRFAGAADVIGRGGCLARWGDSGATKRPLASLFVTDDAQEDAGTITGALDGAFERMMFLTATPFQLGHHELLNVIGRVRGVAWKTLTQGTKEQFEAELKNFGSVLDRAQHRAAELDTAPARWCHQPLACHRWAR